MFSQCQCLHRMLRGLAACWLLGRRLAQLRIKHPVEKDLDQKDASASVPPPNWEEMMEMLRRVPCFTDVKPPLTKMLDFFSLTKRISMNMGGDPPVFVTAQFPFNKLESAVFRI